MATSVVVERDWISQNLAYTTLDVTLSNSYTTGGEEVPNLPSTMKLVLIEPVASYRMVFGRDAHKIRVRTSGGSDSPDHEVAADTDLSSVTVRLFILHTPA